jgi:hypothetical protein
MQKAIARHLFNWIAIVGSFCTPFHRATPFSQASGAVATSLTTHISCY